MSCCLNADQRLFCCSEHVCCNWSGTQEVMSDLPSHIPHSTTQHNTSHHNTSHHNTTQHITTHHSTTQHNTAQHNTTSHHIITSHHNTTQHNTTQQHHNTPSGASDVGGETATRGNETVCLRRAQHKSITVDSKNLLNRQPKSTGKRKRVAAKAQKTNRKVFC